MSGLSAIQADLVDFVQILGSKYWALGGLKQKLKNVLYRGTWRTDGQKLYHRFHRETKEEAI